MTRGAAALAFAALGCSGELGVHVTVTLPEGLWHAGRPFDHIRIEASSMSRIEVACLYPLDNIEPSGVVVARAPASNEPRACADLGPRAIDQSLGSESWGFSAGGTRSVNFVWPNDNGLTVKASAGFGGKIDVFTASAQASPSAKLTEVALALGAAAAPFIGTASCPIDLWNVAHQFGCPDNQAVSCLFPSSEGTRRHTTAMFAVKGIDPRDAKHPGCRVQNLSGGCNDPMTDPFVTFTGVIDVPKVMKNPAPPINVYATMRARFARCASGDMHKDCAVTTDCVPPPSTSIVTAARDSVVAAPKLTLQPIACLPPTAGFVEMRVRVLAIPGEVNVGVLAQVPKNDPKACFLDVLDFDYDVDVKAP